METFRFCRVRFWGEAGLLVLPLPLVRPAWTASRMDWAEMLLATPVQLSTAPDWQPATAVAVEAKLVLMTGDMTLQTW